MKLLAMFSTVSLFSRFLYCDTTPTVCICVGIRLEGIDKRKSRQANFLFHLICVPPNLLLFALYLTLAIKLHRTRFFL